MEARQESDLNAIIYALDIAICTAGSNSKGAEEKIFEVVGSKIKKSESGAPIASEIFSAFQGWRNNIIHSDMDDRQRGVMVILASNICDVLIYNNAKENPSDFVRAISQITEQTYYLQNKGMMHSADYFAVTTKRRALAKVLDVLSSNVSDDVFDSILNALSIELEKYSNAKDASREQTGFYLVGLLNNSMRVRNTTFERRKNAIDQKFSTIRESLHSLVQKNKTDSSIWAESHSKLSNEQMPYLFPGGKRYSGVFMHGDSDKIRSSTNEKVKGNIKLSAN